MRKLLMITILAMFISTGAYAGQVIHVGVNGLVCDFCAQALEKTFGKKEEVESITVDLTEKLVTITLKDGKDISDDVITQIILDSGYNVEKIHRMDERAGEKEEGGHDE